VTAFQTSGQFIEDPQASFDGRWLYFSRRRSAAGLWLLSITAK
jgi:hypothetical protein